MLLAPGRLFSLLEHVERVRDEGERADGIAHDELLAFVSAPSSQVMMSMAPRLGVRPCGIRVRLRPRGGLLTRKKKQVSITRRVMIRACLERPMMAGERVRVVVVMEWRVEETMWTRNVFGRRWKREVDLSRCRGYVRVNGV